MNEDEQDRTDRENMGCILALLPWLAIGLLLLLRNGRGLAF